MTLASAGGSSCGAPLPDPMERTASPSFRVRPASARNAHAPMPARSIATSAAPSAMMAASQFTSFTRSTPQASRTMSTFSGRTSPWRMDASCAAASTSAIWRMTEQASAVGSAPRAATSPSRVRPSSISTTMYGSFRSVVPASRRSTEPGWMKLASASCSRRTDSASDSSPSIRTPTLSKERRAVRRWRTSQREPATRPPTSRNSS